MFYSELDLFIVNCVCTVPCTKLIVPLGAGATNRNEASQMQLINHCKAVAEQVSSLVQAIRLSMNNPDSPAAQLGLINSSQAMIPVSTHGYVSSLHVEVDLIKLS